MYGYIDTYNASTGALKITIPATGSTGGSGTYTGWNISVAGAIGPTGSTGSGAAPAGSIEAFAGSSLPTNYLWCNGAAVSRATYSGLFSAIGTTWGSGDGSTTFNLPNLAGRFSLGAGQGATAYNGGTGTNRSLGQMSNGDPNSGATIAGAETHGQIANELAGHSHSITITDPGHTHNFYGGGANSGSANATWGQANSVYATLNTSLSYSGVTATASVTGSGAQMSIMNPFAVVNYIIRYQ